MKEDVMQRAARWAVFVLFAARAAAEAAAPSEPPLSEGRDFVVFGKDETTKYTLQSPGICALPDGRLFVVYSRQQQGKGRRKPRDGAIEGMYSGDGGRTWSLPEQVIDSARDDQDPATACAPDGTLICTFVPYRERGATGTPLGVHVVMKRPGMQDWTPVVRIAPRCASSSPAHILRDGRLILGLWAAYGTTCVPASISASADAYQWRSTIMMGEDRPPRLAETDIVELANGWLYAMCRIQDKNQDRSFFYSISQDQGETWDQPARLDFSGVRPKLLRTAKNAVFCAYSDEQVLLRCSLDDGTTFGDPVPVDAIGSNSPSMTALPDGSVMIVYAHINLFRVRRFQVEDSGVVWKTFAPPAQ